MNAFWWFKENSIAGMGRPGFNRVRWTDLPLDEAALLGWLGQHSTGLVNLESFRHHLKSYVPKIFRFHKHTDESGKAAMKIFEDYTGLLQVMDRLRQRTQILQDFYLVNDHLNIQMNEKNLEFEINFLKEKKINRVIALTEKHHQKDILQNHFDLHHLAIEDLGAPNNDQAHELAEIINKAAQNKQTIAVHCLAGIGRTSTMLIASHLILGESMNYLESQLKKQNPIFSLTQSQRDFVNSLANSKN